MPETVSCDLCGAEPDSQQALFVSRNFDGDLRPWQFQVVRCPHCGLIFVNPRPAADELSPYYDDHVDHFISRQRKIPSEADLLRHDWRYRGIVQHKPVGKKILDVGCGDGTFLKLMEIRGWEVTGVETAPGPAEYARSVLGLKIQTDLERARFSENSFDVVTFYQALEHLPYPSQTLKEAFRILSPGGLLVVNIPNISTPAFWFFRKHYSYLQVPLHLFFFRPSTLCRLSELAGFKTKTVTFSNGFGALLHSGLLFLQELRFRSRMTPGRGKILLTEGEMGRAMTEALGIENGATNWRSQLWMTTKRIALMGLHVYGRSQQMLHLGEIFSLYARKP